MKIQLDIPKELNKQLKLFRIQNDHKSLQESVIFILNKKLKEEMKNEKNSKVV